jgi:hypothetical protein
VQQSPQATDFALALKDDFRKARAIKTILRGLIDSGGADEALKLVSDRLTGDLKSFGCNYRSVLIQFS